MKICNPCTVDPTTSGNSSWTTPEADRWSLRPKKRGPDHSVQRRPSCALFDGSIAHCHQILDEVQNLLMAVVDPQCGLALDA